MKTCLSIFILLCFIAFSCRKNFADLDNEKSNKATEIILSVPDLKTIDPHLIEIRGYPGQRINDCIEKRIKSQDIDHLIEQFKHKDETWCWQTEFWGKWMLSAVAAYKHKQDKALLDIMRYAVDGLLKTQLPNGYIGNYPPENQLTQWDIWGRKYSMLGLIRFFEITGDETALSAAAKVADHLISQVGPGKVNIVETGNYRGMASSSVLEPIVYLYNHTGDRRYLDFAEYIVGQWETEKGPQLLSKAFKGVNVSDRFPAPERWWSWENGQKAYEMMSCYDGLLELYKVTGNEKYLSAALQATDNIIETEINIAGSGSAFECWYGGAKKQAIPTYHTMETCVTMTWMKFCYNLLTITGNPKYADEIEKSFYNALMASLKFDASEIVVYSPLEGVRSAGETYCDMNINCCTANGPRGFTLIPRFAIMQRDNEVYINYYGESEAEFEMASGGRIKIMQETDYPESGRIMLRIDVNSPDTLHIFLRIPTWSAITDISVNEDNQQGIEPGSYHRVSLSGVGRNEIVLGLDMRGRLVKNNGYQAILKGPVLLARDSRFHDGSVDEPIEIQHENNIVVLEQCEKKPEYMWMSYTAPGVVGTNLGGEPGPPERIYFCDFASAGNTWDPDSRYRVWLRETLNVMTKEYSQY